MSEEWRGQFEIQDDDNSCTVLVDSSDDELKTFDTEWSVQIDDFGCEEVDSDSDVEPARKRVKFCKTCGKDDILVASDTAEHPVITTEDDSSDLEDLVALEDVSCDEDKVSSIQKEIEEFTISKYNASDDIGKENIDENPLNDPVAMWQTSDAEMVTDENVVIAAEQPKKRKCKIKNICVTPAVKGLEKCGPSTKNCTTAQQNVETARVARYSLH